VTVDKPDLRRSARAQGGHPSPKASVNAGIGGVGGGTGMIAIAQVVGTHTVLGQVLMYVAPTVSVIAGTVLYQLKLQADWYGERWQVRRARKTLERQLNSPHASDDHKAWLQKKLEEVDQAVAEAELRRVSLMWQSPKK
jgi:hypothetical protein